MDDILYNGKKQLTDIVTKIRNGEKLTLSTWFPTLTAVYCLVSMLLPWIHIELKGCCYVARATWFRSADTGIYLPFPGSGGVCADLCSGK